jgi:type IV pilus assembly protein PilV
MTLEEETAMLPYSVSPSNRRGFSLIEVMVAILVLAFGMLGVAAMQAVSLKNSQSSFERSQGVLETYAIVDAMRASRSLAIIGDYNLANWTCAPPDATSLATAELAGWINSLKANLSSTACGKIACSNAGCLVEVRWDDSRGTAIPGQNMQEYIVQTRTAL